MHFLISLGTLTGFIAFSGALGYFGGIYTHYKLTHPTPARKG